MTMIEVITNGIFIGFGSAIGTYFGSKVTQHLIEKQFKELKKAIGERKNERKEA